MPKPESILKNEMHEILWNFEYQTGHLILARRPYPIRIGKQKYSRLCHLIRLQNETQDKKKTESSGYTVLKNFEFNVTHQRYTSNRRLQRYGSQMDAYATTPLHRRLYHQGSLQTLVALHLKCLSVSCCKVHSYEKKK